MKKNILLTLLAITLIFLIVFFIYNYIYLKYKNINFIKKTDIAYAEALKNSPFKINKIILFSSRIW